MGKFSAKNQVSKPLKRNKRAKAATKWQKVKKEESQQMTAALMNDHTYSSGVNGTGEVPQSSVQIIPDDAPIFGDAEESIDLSITVPTKTYSKRNISMITCVPNQSFEKVNSNSIYETPSIVTKDVHIISPHAVVESVMSHTASYDDTLLKLQNDVPETDYGMNNATYYETVENAWGSQQDYDSIMNHKLTIEKNTDIPSVLSGNRIVDISYTLSWATNLQYNHSKICTSGKLKAISENNRGTGLCSYITFKCDLCQNELTYGTQRPDELATINKSYVWGTLASGSTFGQTKELLSIMDIPAMSYYTFSTIERELGGLWHDTLWKDMEEAGKEEKILAEGNNQYDIDNIPWITVYVDGGWSKRSYGHSYNAASGVAVIIGKATGKVLFMGVRNKYCSICSRAANRQVPPGDHICFRNWSGSSSAMEADIIVEGFSKSEDLHGLRYKKFVADGDSSVFAKIREKVAYGRTVEKLECTNHAIKNYGKALYKIKSDTTINIAGRKFLTNEKIQKLEKMAKSSIYRNANGNVEMLKAELLNGPNHIFHDHTKCLEHYCEEAGKIENSLVPTLLKTGMYHHIQGALDGLIKKSHKMLENETSNKAELYMSLLAKYNCGKRLNLTQRGSFQLRTCLAGLRYNNGLTWQTSPWKKTTNRSPGKNFKKFINEHQHKQQMNAKRKLEFGEEMKKKKNNCIIINKVMNKDYGPNSHKADLSPAEQASESERILNQLQVTQEQHVQIALETVGQFGNARYEAERNKRLTASNFGNVIRRREDTSCHNLVKSILYANAFISSPAIDFGKRREQVAIAKFEKQTNLKVVPSGLFVDTVHGFLGASPDGLIGENEIIEIKCLFKVHKSGKTLQQCAEVDNQLCVHMTQGVLKLKRTHNYYYQIQGQLNIAKKSKCYFVVYTDDSHPLFIEEIYKDEEFWCTTMVPKLERFYKDCILVELLVKNVTRGERCKEPTRILEAQKNKLKKKKPKT